MRRFLQGPESATNVDVLRRLRYAAFLCGVFSTPVNIFDANVSTPSQFMMKIGQNRSAILEQVIQLSNAKSLSKMSPNRYTIYCFETRIKMRNASMKM